MSGLWGWRVWSPNPTFACYQLCVALGKSLNVVCSWRKCGNAEDVLWGGRVQRRWPLRHGREPLREVSCAPCGARLRGRILQGTFSKSVTPIAVGGTWRSPGRKQTLSLWLLFLPERVGNARSIQSLVLGCLEITRFATGSPTPKQWTFRQGSKSRRAFVRPPGGPSLTRKNSSYVKTRSTLNASIGNWSLVVSAPFADVHLSSKIASVSDTSCLSPSTRIRRCSSANPFQGF